MRITFQDLIKQFSSGVGLELTVVQIVVALLIATALSLWIFWLYKHTYRGVLYSKNFNLSLMMISIIVAILMITITGNLVLALGMVGALSIIRFRHAMKDPLDIVYLFWALAIGITVGVGMYELIFIGSFILSCIILLFNKKVSFSTPYILTVFHSGQLKLEDICNKLKKITKNYRLRNQMATRDEHQVTLEVRLRSNVEIEEVIRSMRELPSVANVTMISYDQDMTF